MLYKSNWFDLQYEAAFRSPFFQLVANPLGVLSGVHSRLSTKWTVTPADIAIDRPRATVADFHARINMFSGNGTLDFTADTVSAKFINPAATGDIEIIKECIQLTNEGLAASGCKDFREEAISMRIFLGLVGDQADGPEYLRTLFREAKLFDPLDDKTQTIPAFRIEFVRDEEKWFFNFDLGRAHRSAKELFVTCSAKFYEGNPFPTLAQKSEHFAKLLQTALSRSGLETQPKETK